MKLRADQVIMGAVVGIGVLAAITLFSGGGRPGDLPVPSPQNPPVGPGQFPKLRQDQQAMKAGTRYWGRYDFASPPSRADIIAQLQSAGFANVLVFESLSEASGAIPAIPLVLENSSSGTRWFQGTATKTANRPVGLTYLWVSTGVG